MYLRVVGMSLSVPQGVVYQVIHLRVWYTQIILFRVWVIPLRYLRVELFLSGTSGW